MELIPFLEAHNRQIDLLERDVQEQRKSLLEGREAADEQEIPPQESIRAESSE